ncbi:hypothetical protein [Profundibacterium mesophilum]|uniref:Prokaryotic membrane lipoprotein lipid attachment site domain containing protein n=1 Tax=Profundibacterium mesophilum KAUST100406-0324 TaxID=1037889 RepID=A0A921TEI9_9RHOB|nr:hypothetical protein [Profundibacterium mesophilum]KAF0677356.1 Prokaryotic membrane lipoprotein lipid attachment site domain containing protein [Profundibacterium mesophilum KAUST100406-0324]
MHSPLRNVAALALIAAGLAACAPTPRVGEGTPEAPNVRHFASTQSFGNGARWHLFLFDPSQPRSLDTRLTLARRAIEREPDCRWVDAPRDQIEEQTRDQGARYTQSVLAAPLRCKG